MNSKAERLRALNDQLRTTFIGGTVMITKGIEAIPFAKRKRILEQVRSFGAFDAENDPTASMIARSSKPRANASCSRSTIPIARCGFIRRSADPAVTARILTIMLASEY